MSDERANQERERQRQEEAQAKVKAIHALPWVWTETGLSSHIELNDELKAFLENGDDRWDREYVYRLNEKTVSRIPMQVWIARHRRWRAG